MIKDGVSGADIEMRIKKSMRRAGEAPLIVVLCHDKKTIKPLTEDFNQQAEALMGVQSVAQAGLQLLLAAHAEGLGGTWICWPLFAPEETQSALGLTSDWEPQGMVFLGYPDETPEMSTRIPLHEVTRFL
jgi:nitroreductase